MVCIAVYQNLFLQLPADGNNQSSHGSQENTNEEENEPLNKTNTEKEGKSSETEYETLQQEMGELKKVSKI